VLLKDFLFFPAGVMGGHTSVFGANNAEKEEKKTRKKTMTSRKKRRKNK